MPFLTRARLTWPHWLSVACLLFCAFRWGNVFGNEPDLFWLGFLMASLLVTVMTGLRADERKDDWLRLNRPRQQFPAA